MNPRGRTPAAATVSTTPCTAVTTLRHRRAGNGARNHGHTHSPTKNRYRANPINNTHPPNPDATYTLSTSIRNASTSPSKRAPNSDAVPVRRANHPSNKSNPNATAESATNNPTGTPRVKESPTSAATPTVNVARTNVTHDAGSSRFPRPCARPRASTAAMATAQPRPTAQPAAPSPTVAAMTASSSTWAISPIVGPA